MIRNKKAQILDGLGIIGIGIVSITIILTVAFLVLAQVKDSQIDFIDSTGFTNSTTAITLNSFTIINAGCINEETLSVTQVINTSNAVIIPADNYTVVDNAINITNQITNGASFNITYSCKLQSIGVNSTETLQNATQTVPGWVPLIVIVMIGALILLLVTKFGRTG